MDIEVIFKGKTLSAGRIEYLHKNDYEAFCRQYPDTDVLVHIKPQVKNSTKINLYAFYQAVVVPLTIKALTDDGWPGVSEDMADSYLKNALAKGITHNPKTDEKLVYLMEKKRMTKDRLTKFVSDCIMLLETRHNCQVPDSQAYLENKRTGFLRNFKKMK